MKTNSEIRKEAREIVHSRWLGRIVAAGGSLYLITFAVTLALVFAYMDLGIQTWLEFLKAKAEHLQQGLCFDVPSAAVFWQMTGASLFQQFISYVFGAILLFGFAALMLKVVRNEEDGWFAATYSGFCRPFGTCWLLLLMNLKIFLWALLFVIPGIVAIYRYRQAWYLKCEHPDWNAGKCLAESSAMMKGHKAQAFWLDVSYFLRILAIWILFIVLGICFSNVWEAIWKMPLCRIAVLILISICFAGFILVCFAFLVARAVFYRELRARARDML